MEKTLQTKVKDFMTKKVIAVTENETIEKLFKLMDKSGILGVPVVDNKRHVIGIITETDLIEHFTTLKEPRSVNLLGSIVYLENIEAFNKNLKEHCAELVKDLMTSPVVTAKEEDTLLAIINRMSEHNLSRLPVVNRKNELTGIVTRSDVVHELAKIKKI